MLDSKRACDWIGAVCTTLLQAGFTLLPETLPSYLTFAGLLAGIFIFKTRGRVEIKLEPFYIFEVLIILFTAASSLWAANPSWSLRKVRQLTVNFAFFSIIYGAYSNEKDVWPLIRCLKWAGYIVAFYVVRFYGPGKLFSMLMSNERIGYEIANSNRLGMGIAWSCLFTIVEMAHFKKLNLSCLMLVPALLVMSATQSRKAILIVAIGAIMTCCFYFVKPNQIIRSIISISLIAALSYIMLTVLKDSSLFSGIYRRMEYLVNFYIKDEGPTGGSVIAREMMIEAGWQQFIRMPILGVGIGCAVEGLKYVNTHDWWAYLHNNYVELLAGGGIVGFTIFYSRYAYLAIKMNQYRNTLKQMVFPCIIVIVTKLIIDYGLVSYFEKPHEIYLLIVFLQIKYAFSTIESKCSSVQTARGSKYIKGGIL